MIKTKSGVVLGFIAGMAGFLLLFKIIILDHTSPADELAPGLVLIAAVISGGIFAFAGRAIQNHMAKNGK